MLFYSLVASVMPALCTVLLLRLIPPSILGRAGRALSLVATGLLLTMALTHLIPEALHDSPHTAGLALWLTVFALIFLEMYFNGRTARHDASQCSCPCHRLHPNRAENDLLLNPKISFRNDNSPVLSLRPLDPTAKRDEAASHAQYGDNRCHHGLLQHFGHDHDFNLHGVDIAMATRRAEQNHEEPAKRIRTALSNGAAAVLGGASMHALCDGIVICSAFMISPETGFAVTAAIIAHEVPQQLSNYVLMLTFGMSRMQGYVVNAVSACGALIGALLFFFLSKSVEGALPVALAVAGGSFVYVALCDILPRLNRDGSPRVMLIRCAYLLAGALPVLLLSHH